MTPMTTSAQGLGLLIEREALMTEAYPDPASDLFRACLRYGVNPYNQGYQCISGWRSYHATPWTIGVGHTGPEVVPGLVWSVEKCREVFAADVAIFERAVIKAVIPDLKQFQFDALVSFSHNCGQYALAYGNEGGPSSILRAINAGNMELAARCFDNWHVPPSVSSRRNGEREQFRGTTFQARIP